MSDLLKQFIAEDCTLYTRGLLEGAIRFGLMPRPQIEFNRFQITIERETGIVVLEDLYDPNESGVVHVPLVDFVAAIGQVRSVKLPPS